MRPRIVVFGALGTVVTLLAAAVVFAPGFVQDVEPLAGLAAALEKIDRRQLLLVASLVVGLFVSAATWRASGAGNNERDTFDEATAGPPEDVTTDAQRLTAADLEAAVEAAIDGDDAAAEQVRERLQETATRAHAHETGVAVKRAREQVRAGEWTDDRLAAAVLADEGGPTHSLWSRLRLWLDPESERERRLHRAVRETTALGGGEP
jgi:hypothetical protein